MRHLPIPKIKLPLIKQKLKKETGVNQSPKNDPLRSMRHHKNFTLTV